MPIRVQMPDGGIAEFPDGMAPAEIEAALAGSARESNITPPGREGESDVDYAMRVGAKTWGTPTLPGLSVVGRVDPVQKLIAAGADKAAGAVKDFGQKLVLSFVKPRFSELQQRAGIEGTTPTAVAQRIARFMVDNRITTSQKAQDLVKGSGQQVDDAIAAAEQANPNLALDTAERTPRYLNVLLRRIEKQILPGKDRTAVQNVAKELVEDSPLSTKGPAPRQFTPRGDATANRPWDSYNKPMTRRWDQGPAPEPTVIPRQLRADVKPSEGMQIARTKSFFDPQASGASIAGGKTIERALRDSIKQAVPEAAGPLRAQGRAMDAFRLLERGEHLAQNRDTLGGFAQTMALAGNLRGLLAQLLKEGQLRIGAGAAPRLAAGLQQAGQGDPATVQALLAQLMGSHGQEQ